MRRFLPNPLPKVQYIPEYQATGALKESYEDMKQVLQVPWMGVVTMAYAHFPNFFKSFWAGYRALCSSQEFQNAALQLRADIEKHVLEMAPPTISERLRMCTYSENELDDIRAVLEVLSHGNYQYTLLTTAARYLLEGGELAQHRSFTPLLSRHAPPPRVPLVLMEEHHVDIATKQIYSDLKQHLGLPFVNTDYRALARWPSYFGMAWADLRPHLNTDKYNQVCEIYQTRALELIRSLPNPEGVTSQLIRQAANEDNSADLLPVIQLFQHLHAGLMTNVAFFRSQLLK
jgi:hypothetical protein